ncbi:MAG: MerR family transcriptional regulator [Clostridiales bacterium]|nr:MerR family transcriptional regulator [Clostridiales bacterium]
MERKTLREICCSTGVTRRAIQGYEKAGLVAASGKNKYGHLLYDHASEERISEIRFYQKIGFSLKNISGIIDAPNELKKAALQKQLVIMEVRCRETQENIKKLNQLLADL